MSKHPDLAANPPVNSEELSDSWFEEGDKDMTEYVVDVAEKSDDEEVVTYSVDQGAADDINEIVVPNILPDEFSITPIQVDATTSNLSGYRIAQCSVTFEDHMPIDTNQVVSPEKSGGVAIESTPTETEPSTIEEETAFEIPSQEQQPVQIVHGESIPPDDVVEDLMLPDEEDNNIEDWLDMEDEFYNFDSETVPELTQYLIGRYGGRKAEKALKDVQKLEDNRGKTSVTIRLKNKLKAKCKVVYTVVGRFGCPSCEKSFKFNKNLKTHLRTEHEVIVSKRSNRKSSPA